MRRALLCDSGHLSFPWALVFSQEQEESKHRCLGIRRGAWTRGRKPSWNLPWAQLSAFETGGEAKQQHPRSSVFRLQKAQWRGQEEEEPRERKEPLQSRTHLLFQLPGLLPPEQHLVPGLLVGVCHQRVSVVRPQLWEEQRQAGQAPGTGGAGLEPPGGRGAPVCVCVWTGSRPSPAAWSSASCSSGFCGSPLPCPWRELAGCARQAGSWGGCSWDNTTGIRSPRKFL